VHLTDDTARLIAAVRRFGVDFVIFNDHLAEGRAMQARRPADFALWARKLGRDPADLGASLDAAEARAADVPRHLCSLGEAFDELRVAYGSHDDPDGETREFYTAMGARICEFPTQMPAASVARALGAPVLMGAPNVVRGGSQAGNISARMLIQQGKCDGLVSDYHYPALAKAAFALVDQEVMDLPRAWGLISKGPAQIMRMTDRGEIAPGKRADLTIVNKATRAVEATMVAGRIAYLAGEAAERFIGLPRAVSMAAE
jgi:alpha-D-ribose 1-methylphosphonate 5-triphosphate diphosphatase